MRSEFKNEPLTDFSDPENARRMEAALEKVRGELGRTYPSIVDGREITAGEKVASVNPARPDQVVGYVVQATIEQTNEAIEAANRRFAEWSRTPAEERAGILFRTADMIRERKFELSAWMVYEVSKSWVEADADVAELIDFADYYAHQMLRLAGPQPVMQYPGEYDEMRYIPLGAVAVIPPWNFPAAIMGGMTAAALVTGNTAVLKPAPTSPVIAMKFVEILEEAGLPSGVLHVVHGDAAVGSAMVDHPKTRAIAFTGSREVGVLIYERAAKVRPGQTWLKRMILEMGGKDAVVVDETADPDAAAQAIVASAFGFQGQKCSAGSRAIVVADVYDTVLAKAVEHARTLTMGDPAERGTYMGAVVDQSAFDKIRQYIEVGKTEGRLVLGGEAEAKGGYFIPPTIFADVDPEARLAQEEIFGPVLAFIKARDFDHALEIANGTEYGLTGAVFTQREERLKRAVEEYHVGNLYLNRKCTGALVGVHPFGGFNMSGTDSKAGGPDYLQLFLQAKSIAEKLPGSRPSPVRPW